MQDEAVHNSCHDAHAIPPNPCRNAQRSAENTVLSGMLTKLLFALIFWLQKLALDGQWQKPNSLCTLHEPFLRWQSQANSYTHFHYTRRKDFSPQPLHSSFAQEIRKMGILREDLGNLYPCVLCSVQLKHINTQHKSSMVTLNYATEEPVFSLSAWHSYQLCIIYSTEVHESPGPNPAGRGEPRQGSSTGPSTPGRHSLPTAPQLVGRQQLPLGFCL